MADDLLFSIEDGVATATINRPEAYNAMKTTMWGDILKFAQDIEHQSNVRVLVITGKGKNFCSGADVTEFAKTIDKNPQELATHWMRQSDLINPLFITLERIPQPVIVSARGIAAGGGLGLVAAADLIIASETSRFFAAQIKLGAIPDSAVYYNLPKAIGMKKAKQYCLTGDEMNAQTAADLGLVNWIVPDDQLEAETAKLASRLAKLPAVAVSATKATMNDVFNNTLTDHFLVEALDVGCCVSAPDFAKNVRAFVERKK